MSFVKNAVLALLLVVAGSSCAASEVRPDHDDADLHAIAQVGGRVAWAVGDRGAAWFTRDSGQTWSAVPLPGQVACRSVCFLTDRVGWIAGMDEQPGRTGGVLLATRDGGALWKTIPAPVRMCIMSVFSTFSMDCSSARVTVDTRLA